MKLSGKKWLIRIILAKIFETLSLNGNYVYYKVDKNVLQYFNEREARIVSSNAFAKNKKKINKIELWDVEVTWYSPSATRWMFLSSFENILQITAFSPTWPCPIVEILITWCICLDLSDQLCLLYSQNDSFCLHLRHYDLVELVNNKLPN